MLPRWRPPRTRSATSRCATAAPSAARSRRPIRTATCRRSRSRSAPRSSSRAAAGTRTIAADDFFVDYFTTALDEGDLITEIRIPGGQSQGAYAKFNRRSADWALIGAAVSKGAGRLARRPLRRRARRRCAPPGVEAALAAGASPADASLEAAEGISPEADLGGSEEYKRHLATVMVRRALEAAGA